MVIQRDRRRQIWRENPRADGTWPWSIPAVKTLDSASDEEMAGEAVSESKNQNQISSNYSEEELTGILDLI